MTSSSISGIEAVHLPMRIRAPAKINLHLRVAPAGDNGFHPLLSWMCTVSLFDSLKFSAAGWEGPPLVNLSCDDATLACDATNLVMRCGLALATELTTPPIPVHIELRKCIPMGAGLGGGSSDGAAALCGLNRLWNAGLRPSRLAHLAARFGSDLPFFFHGPSSICRGRGEIVRPTPAPQKARWGLLILSEILMPTPAVYRHFDRLLASSNFHVTPLDPEPDFAQWSTLVSEKLLERLINDLEPAAFAIAPELDVLRKSLQELLARSIRMSGSGSSLFTLYDTLPEAQSASEIVDGLARDRSASLPRFRSLAIELSPNIEADLNASHDLAY